MELVFYIPCLICPLILTRRHGFARQFGWIYLAAFAIIRGTGSVLQIVDTSHGNPSLENGAVILSNIGLSLLLLCMCKLLDRVYVYKVSFRNFSLRLTYPRNQGMEKRNIYLGIHLPSHSRNLISSEVGRRGWLEEYRRGSVD